MPNQKAAMLVVLGLVAMGAAAIVPTAAAHDPYCVVTFHHGPVKVHYDCEVGRQDESNCVASVMVFIVHQRFMCR